MENRRQPFASIAERLATAVWFIRNACESPLVAISFALVVTGMAFLLRIAMHDSTPRFVIMFPAVAICALLGGPISGLVAMVAASLLMGLFVLGGGGTAWLANPNDVASLTNFIVTGLLVSAIAAVDRSVAARSARIARDQERTEARHRTAIDALHDGVLVFTREGRILSANPAAQRILGMSEAELRAMTGGFAEWQVVGDDGAALAVENFPAVRVFRTGRPRHGDVVGVPRGDGVCWLLNHADPIIDPLTGDFDTVVVSITDVTERRRFERELAEGRANLASIFAALHEGVMVVSPEGRLLNWNPSAERILRGENGDFRGLENIYADRQLLREDGTPMPIDEYPSLQTLHRGVTSHGVVVGAPVGDGHVWLLVNSEPIRDPHTGAIIAAVVSLNDITERRRAERELAESQARLASIFTALHEGVMVLGPDGRALSWNPALRRIFRLSATADIAEERAALLRRGLIDEDGVRLTDGDYPSRRTLLTGESVHGRVFGVDFDGETVWVSANFEPILDPASGAIVAAVASFNDITARRRAEQDLRDSRARFASVVESAMDAIVTVDGAQRIVLFNAAAERMFGCRAADVLGKTIDRFVPVRLRERHAAGFRAFAAGESLSRVMGQGIELTACDVDGREFPIEASISRTDVGDQQLYTVIHRDISARVAAERTNAHLATVVNSSPDAIVTVTLEGRIGTWNAAAQRMFGYTAEEAVGQPIGMLSFPATPDHGHAIYERVRQGQSVQVETVRRRRDGTAIEVASSAAAIRDAAGEVVAGVAILADISERKRKERLLAERDVELRQTLDAAGLGVWWIDVTEGVVHSDLRSRALFATDGVAPQERVAESFHVDDRATFLGIRDLLAKADGGRTLVLRVTAADGALRWLALTARTRTTERGDEEIWGTVHDITEQRTAEQALKQVEASRRLEALGRMTGGIAHDFNNLLTVISGNLQLLELDPGAPSAGRFIAEALRATESGAALNRRLTTFARQRRLEPTVTDLDERIGSMVDLMHRSVGPKITVSATFGGEPALVRVDPSEIENAVLNLVFNARDAMPDGGRIAIEIRNVAVDESTQPAEDGLHSGPYVRLSVSDTGVGMSPEVKARAFEPFFTTKEIGKGTGLGLASLHGFVRQSGGFVTLYSELGHGTTVNIYLPRVEVGGQPVEPMATPEIPFGAGETILVVEDNPDVGRVTSERLSALGYRVREVANAAEALEALEALAGDGAIDLVFSDIMMPGGLSGIDLARRLRADDPDRRILLSSGFAEEIARGGVEAPIEFTVLRKPCSLAELAQAVADALRPAGGPVAQDGAAR